MLVLDGYTLIGEDKNGRIASLIQEYLPIESYFPWYNQLWPGFGLSGLTYPNQQRIEPKFEIGKFTWPTCASRFAYGHYLCDSDAVGLMVQDAYDQTGGGAYNALLFMLGNPEYNQQGTITTGESITTPVYLLPPTPLSVIRGLTGMIESLYLLTIVDVRYFWWQYNMGSIVVDNSTTWTSLIQSIATILDITITPDIIDPAYLQPSIQMFSLPYEPIPLILDAICMNIGHRFVASYSGGMNFQPVYTTQLYQTALDILNLDMQNNAALRNLAAGGQRFANPL